MAIELYKERRLDWNIHATPKAIDEPLVIFIPVES